MDMEVHTYDDSEDKWDKRICGMSSTPVKIPV